MANVSFGRQQLKNPTPANISGIIAVFTVIASSIIAWIGTATFIPSGPSTIIQSFLGLGIGIANGLKPFFGVETNGKTSIPTNEVTAMESKPDLSSMSPAAPGDQQIQNK